MTAASATDGVRPHRLFEVDGGATKGIVIGDWEIATTKRPICNAAELDKISERVSIQLPEMLFGNNHLVVAHRPSGVRVSFGAVDALAKVDDSPEAASKIQVSHAEHWSRNRSETSDTIQDVVRPYDWTYTTDYAGTLSIKDQLPSGVTATAAMTPASTQTPPSSSTTCTYQDDSRSAPTNTFVPSKTGIDVQRLLAYEPILFYDELVLYEDELADNGIALLSLRVRVMPTCFLVLQRFFLRVDNVLFRVNDTRLYHEFGADYLVRDFRSREAPFDVVKQMVPCSVNTGAGPNAGDDSVRALADAAWVARTLETLSQGKNGSSDTVEALNVRGSA